MILSYICRVLYRPEGLGTQRVPKQTYVTLRAHFGTVCGTSAMRA